MRLSTSTNIAAFAGAQGRNPLSFCIALCARAGYRVLDVNFCEAMNPNSRLRGDDWAQYVEQIGQLGRELGVEFAQAHLPYYDMFGAQDQAPAMETLIRRSVIACGMLGVKWAVAHPGTLGGGPRACLQANLTYYAPHVLLAQQVGVGIALENDFGPSYCASIAQLCDLCDAFASNSVGACYDFGHAHLAGGDHRGNLRLLGARLKAVHVHDNHGGADEHLMPFSGTIHWQDAMAGLKAIGYAGDLTYEIQAAGQYYPNAYKHLLIEHSVQVGHALMDMFVQA